MYEAYLTSIANAILLQITFYEYYYINYIVCTYIIIQVLYKYLVYNILINY